MPTVDIEDQPHLVNDRMLTLLAEQVSLHQDSDLETLKYLPPSSHIDDVSHHIQHHNGRTPTPNSSFYVMHIPKFKYCQGTSAPLDTYVNYVTVQKYTGPETIYRGKLFLPHGLLSCELSLIAFTCIGTTRHSGDLLFELFLQGYGAAEFEPHFLDTFEFERISITNVQETPQRTIIPIPYLHPQAVIQSHEDDVEFLPTSAIESTLHDRELHDPNYYVITPTYLDFRAAATATVTSGISGSYKSARSTFNSPASFVSARSAYNSPAFLSEKKFSPNMRIETIREDEPPPDGHPQVLTHLHHEYYTNLHKQEIIQPFDKELNWSGKGQHVTFAIQEKIPLSHISHLGSSLSATVDKVLCRRVALARKTMRCDRRWTVADALQEVYHLQNLHHFHIVQLVGTYLQGRNFSILMYPAADSHLGRFLEDTLDLDACASLERRTFLGSTLGCLTSAVAFIHEQTTKHMDIKPHNILVRSDGSWWRVYITDFGLSRSFASQGHSQTDGPTSRTPRYCAPEVYNYEQRGRSADVFSLGCVFLEILTTVCHIDLHVFTDARRGDGDDESFHANLERAVWWARRNLRASKPVINIKRGAVADDAVLEMAVELVISMVAREPEKRPTAAQVIYHLRVSPPLSTFSPMVCCRSPQEPYEAYQPSPL